MGTHQYRNGFTLLELLTVIGVIGVLVCLLLPAIQSAREAARRMSCSNNFKQVALGVAQYHDAFGILPPHGTGTFNHQNDPAKTNQFRLSFLVSITPFVGQSALWEMLNAPLTGQPPGSPNNFADDWSMEPTIENEPQDHVYPAMGPSPSTGAYEPWNADVAVYRCPSDPGIGLPSLGRTNYAACLGDAIEGLDEGLWRYENGIWSPSGESQMAATGRGAFVPRMTTQWADITDGLSNTILLGEICTGLGDEDSRTVPSLGNGWDDGVLTDIETCTNQFDVVRPLFWDTSLIQLSSDASAQRGFRWADSMPLMTGCNTTRPPNAELCFGGDPSTIGTLTISSRHPGGAHIALCDGSIRFVTDSISCYGQKTSVTKSGVGDFSPGSQSPFGLWGALGTRNQRELIDVDY